MDESRIQNYLIEWKADIFAAAELPKAYEQDTYHIGEDWQMADFMEAIGYPYNW